MHPLSVDKSLFFFNAIEKASRDLGLNNESNPNIIDRK